MFYAEVEPASRHARWVWYDDLNHSDISIVFMFMFTLYLNNSQLAGYRQPLLSVNAMYNKRIIRNIILRGCIYRNNIILIRNFNKQITDLLCSKNYVTCTFFAVNFRPLADKIRNTVSRKLFVACKQWLYGCRL